MLYAYEEANEMNKIFLPGTNELGKFLLFGWTAFKSSDLFISAEFLKILLIEIISKLILDIKAVFFCEF